MVSQLDDSSSEFEKAVFESLYRSREQRLLRFTAMLLLLVRHLARGLIILWPAYLVLLATFLLPNTQQVFSYLLLLSPGLLIWLYIYIAGARDDYRRMVQGKLLDNWRFR